MQTFDAIFIWGSFHTNDVKWNGFSSAFYYVIYLFQLDFYHLCLKKKNIYMGKALFY